MLSFFSTMSTFQTVFNLLLLYTAPLAQCFPVSTLELQCALQPSVHSPSLRTWSPTHLMKTEAMLLEHTMSPLSRRTTPFGSFEYPIKQALLYFKDKDEATVTHTENGAIFSLELHIHEPVALYLPLHSLLLPPA